MHNTYYIHTHTRVPQYTVVLDTLHNSSRVVSHDTFISYDLAYHPKPACFTLKTQPQNLATGFQPQAEILGFQHQTETYHLNSRISP